MNQLNRTQTASPQHVPALSAGFDVLDLLTSTTEQSESNLVTPEISAGQRPEVVQPEQAQALPHSVLETKQSNNESEKDTADLTLTELTQKGGGECKILVQSKTAQLVNSSAVVKPLGDLTVSLDSIKPGTFY